MNDFLNDLPESVNIEDRRGERQYRNPRIKPQVVKNISPNWVDITQPRTEEMDIDPDRFRRTLDQPHYFMNEPLPVDTGPLPVNPPISADVTTTPPVSDTVAQDRAFKARVGMPSFEMSSEDIYQSIKGGQEDAVRDQAARQMDFQKALQRERMITNFVKHKGANATQGELDMLGRAASAMEQGTDPKSVIEEYYAMEYGQILDKAAPKLPDSEYNRAMKDNPYATENIKRLGISLVAKQQFANTTLQNLTSEYENQSWAGWVFDRASELIPGATDVQLRGNVPGTGFFEGGFLGGNLRAQAEQLARLPFPQFKEQLLKITNELKKTNPGLAVQFAHAVVGQSTSQEMMNNFTTVVDASFIKPLSIYQFGKSIPNSIAQRRLAKEAEGTIKSMIESVNPNTATRADMHEAVGDLGEAAVTRVTDNVVSNFKATNLADLPETTKTGLQHLQSIYTQAITDLRSNYGNLDRELINRIEEAYTKTSEQLQEVILNTMRVERLPAVFAVEKNVRAILNSIRTEFPGLDNTILDILTPKKDPLTTTYHVDVLMGKSDGTLFGNAKDAQTFMNNAGLVGEVVEREMALPSKSLNQKGVGYFVKVSRPLRETDSVVRDALLATAETKTPNSWVNAWGGYMGSLRTPEDVLSMEQLLNRKVATFGPSNWARILKESAKEIRELQSWSSIPFTDKKRKWTEWTRVVDEADKNDRLYKHPVELQDAYQRLNGRLPDDQEIAAYFAHKRSEESLKVFEKLGAFRDLSRQGAMTHTIRTYDPTIETRSARQMTPDTQVTVNAVRLHKWEDIGEDTLMRVRGDLGEESLYFSKDIRGKALENIKKDIEEGKLVLLKLTNPEERPFAHWPKIDPQTRIRYVVTDNVDFAHSAQPLSWDHLPVAARRNRYDYEHYIAQADVRHDTVSGKHWYERDVKIFADNIGARAREIAGQLDKMRLLLKAGDVEGARALTPLPNGFDEIQSWFLPRMEGGKTIAPRLSYDEPITVVPRNKTIGQMDNKLRDRYDRPTGTEKKSLDVFRDGTIEGYARGGIPDVHEIYTLEKTGTKANPLSNMVPATTIDTMTSLNRALNKAVNNIFLDDYKIFSVEHWIQEAKQFMTTDQKLLSHSPFYYFYHPEWNAGADLKTVNNLKAAQFQIKQFLGIENETATFIHYATQKLADSIYEKAGPRLALYPAAVLPYVRDPVGALRSFTFHEKLGLFNPAQLLTQAQTFSVILGVAGYKYAAPGTKAAMLHAWSGTNAAPEIIAAMDAKAATQLIPGTARFRPGDFTEANALLRNSGFGNVAGEHALKDNPVGFDIVKTGFREKFLNPGAYFFNKGEQWVRYGAFYTSYLEWRTLNPTKALTEADGRSILQRADLLNVNMSRASNSKLQEGVMAIPMQFLTYQLRLAELFVGKRLTSEEKYRLFMTSAAIYGVPGAVGIGGLPIGDWVRQTATEQGYVVGEDWGKSAIMEGLPSMLGALITGKWYNVGEKFGVQGFDQIRESMQSDKTMLDLFGGAAFSSIRNTMKSLYPYGSFVGSFIRGDEERFTLQPAHFVDNFKEISTVNKAWQLAMAINTGKWFSKSENYLADTGAANAIFMAMSGLNPQAITDANIKSFSEKETKALQDETLKRFTKEFRRGLMAYEANNPGQGDAYMKNARSLLVLGDYPIEKWYDAVSIATQGYEKLPDIIDKKFYLDKTPQSQKDVRTKAYETIQRMKQQGQQ